MNANNKNFIEWAMDRLFMKKKVSPLAYSFLSFFVFLLSPMVHAQSSESLEQLPRPVINAIKIDQSPSLDGDISGDSAWNGVKPTSGFTQIQPNVGNPASQKTEVYMGYTEDAIYIGVIAYDKNPENIIVSDSRRDSGLDNTDSFRLVIAVSYTHLRAHET